MPTKYENDSFVGLREMQGNFKAEVEKQFNKMIEATGRKTA